MLAFDSFILKVCGIRAEFTSNDISDIYLTINNNFKAILSTIN